MHFKYRKRQTDSNERVKMYCVYQGRDHKQGAKIFSRKKGVMTFFRKENERAAVFLLQHFKTNQNFGSGDLCVFIGA